MDIPNTEEEPMFYTVSGKEYCDEERALAQLLLDGILFCNERETVEYDYKVVDGQLHVDETKGTSVGEATTVLYVNCNDLFYWACADAERIKNNEIGTFYKMHMANKKWGSAKWCCLKRKMRPQVPIVEAMKKDGFWDAELEALPAPHPS